MIPKANISAFGDSFESEVKWKASGGIYLMLPFKLLVVLVLVRSLAIPKSHIFKLSSLSINRLIDFMSRCKMFLSCRYLMPLTA